MINSSNLAPMVLVTAIVVFGIYRRVRRNIGRQTLTAGRQYARMGIFTAICLLLLLASGHALQPRAVAYIASGLIVGAAVGWFALRHTEFEATPEGYFYTPHLYIGIAVTALFIGRILYRFAVLYSVAGNMGTGQPPPAPDSNPLTFGILFLTAGYYIVYCTGLLRWLRTAQASVGAKLAPTAPDGA
ncbi:MAG: hypothetical protein WA825_05875 [Steroidobacteraceae bacterium]